ncbi:MAG: hypothetical protein IJU75_02820 [Clostridia bacterium]|nr:hypothetical protein [Clostridia bacterium]
MKRAISFFLAALCALILAGCGGVVVDLPDDPEVFDLFERDDIESVVLKNGDNEYVIFGMLKSRGLFDLNYAFGKCVGYVSGDKNDRIFEPKGEKPEDWLVRYYVGGVMDQPVVLRNLASALSGEGAVPDCVRQTLNIN